MMKLTSLVLLVALASPVLADSDELRVADEWLRAHAGEDPDEAGLDELKSVNPDAFAIVNALLTKRSMGLLDSKHPNPSFTDQAAPLNAVPDIQSGSSVAIPVEAVALPHPQPSANKDWLNWKPSTSAADDDAMVKNVLGAVTQLRGGVTQPVSDAPTDSSQAQSAPAEPPSVHADEAAIVEARVEPQAPAAPAQVQAHVDTPSPKPQSGMISFNWGNTYAGTSDRTPAESVSATPAEEKKEAPSQASPNPYLSGVDFNSDTPATASMSQQNSYLKDFAPAADTSDAAKPKPRASSAMASASLEAGPLASFSWSS